VFSGCAGRAPLNPSSRGVDGDVAARFAATVVRGDAAGAKALLIDPDRAPLAFLVQRAAARWRIRHAAIRRPARRTGDRWIFGYVGTRMQSGGRFETERGDLFVVVTASRGVARVRFFGFDHVRTMFSTHHDARLLPSKR
jgi:hypothetical protein